METGGVTYDVLSSNTKIVLPFEHAGSSKHFKNVVSSLDFQITTDGAMFKNRDFRYVSNSSSSPRTTLKFTFSEAVISFHLYLQKLLGETYLGVFTFSSKYVSKRFS